MANYQPFIMPVPKAVIAADAIAIVFHFSILSTIDDGIAFTAAPHDIAARRFPLPSVPRRKPHMGIVTESD